MSAFAGSSLLHDAPHSAKKDENHASHIEDGRSRVLSIVDLGWVLDFRSEASCKLVLIDLSRRYQQREL